MEYSKSSKLGPLVEKRKKTVVSKEKKSFRYKQKKGSKTADILNSLKNPRKKNQIRLRDQKKGKRGRYER